MDDVDDEQQQEAQDSDLDMVPSSVQKSGKDSKQAAASSSLAATRARVRDVV